MLEDYIRGNATKNSVIFQGKNYEVLIRRKSRRDLFMNIPILRGIVKAWALLMIYYAILTVALFSPYLIQLVSPLVFIFTVLIMFTILILGIVINNNAREYHGAEHKVANAFFNDNDVDLSDIELIKQYPIECKRCGSTYLTIFSIISLVITFLIWRLSIPDFIWKLEFLGITITLPVFKLLVPVLFPGIAYELHISNKDSWLIKKFINLAFFIQKYLLVAPPSDDKIALASHTLQKLRDMEKNC